METTCISYLLIKLFLGARPNFVSQNASGANSDQDSNVASTFTPTKIILTGEKKKTLHKEELTMSETERVLKTRTEHHAAIMQKRRSGEGVKKTADKEAKVPKQQVLNILDHSIKKSLIPYSTCSEWKTWWPTCTCNGYYMYM